MECRDYQRIPVVECISRGLNGSQIWRGDGNTNLCNSVFNDLLVFHIAFVAYKQLVDALCGVTVDFLQPLLDVIERVHVCHVVNHADSMSASVVGGCDGSESFLASCIPL